MIVNIRTIELYSYILNNPYKTVKELAQDMSVDERKIRYEIEKKQTFAKGVKGWFWEKK